MTIYENFQRLIAYALNTASIVEDDVIYTLSRLMELFKLEGGENEDNSSVIPISYPCPFCTTRYENRRTGRHSKRNAGLCL